MIILPLAFFIAAPLAAYVVAVRCHAQRLAVLHAVDPMYGRRMPCGDRYLGNISTIAGLTYYTCERGHPFPQQNRGGLLGVER
jgi:hypothetical protein